VLPASTYREEYRVPKAKQIKKYECRSKVRDAGEVSLKVLSNEKRGNLKVVAFDRSPFKLFTLTFSNKSMQAPSC
jgi:hypothetical protein